MKPVDQLRLPPGGSSGLSSITTKPGRFSHSLPRPYSDQEPRQGRPPRMLPVFIWQMPPTWFNPSDWQLRITAMSSTHVAISGYQSLTQMPDWPCCANFRCEANSGVKAVLPIAVTGRTKLAGSGLPASFVSAGFGSNKSIWLGPPSMKHQMTLLACAGNCGGFGSDRVREPSRRGDRSIAGQKRSQREAPKPGSGAGQKIAARSGHCEMGLLPFCSRRQSTYRNSFEFRIAWQKSTIAAACAGGIGFRKRIGKRFFVWLFAVVLDGRRLTGDELRAEIEFGGLRLAGIGLNIGCRDQRRDRRAICLPTSPPSAAPPNAAPETARNRY